MPGRHRATISPGQRQRHRDPVTHTAIAHNNQRPAAPLREQHRKALPEQRMERMRDDKGTQIRTG